jgi:hypothetical protein
VDYIFSLCPDFEAAWLEHARSLDDIDITYSLLLSKFAEYIVNNYQQADLTAIFGLIELCLSKGEKDVQEAFATVLLEDLQNISGNQDINPDIFVPFMQPQTKQWWDEINRFWTDLEKHYLRKPLT